LPQQFSGLFQEQSGRKVAAAFPMVESCRQFTLMEGCFSAQAYPKYETTGRSCTSYQCPCFLLEIQKHAREIVDRHDRPRTHLDAAFWDSEGAGSQHFLLRNLERFFSAHSLQTAFGWENWRKMPNTRKAVTRLGVLDTAAALRDDALRRHHQRV
jgi:hypothetical protein